MSINKLNIIAIGICFLLKLHEVHGKSFQQGHEEWSLNSVESEVDPFVYYIDQYIDHFNYGGAAGSDGTYKQRYLVLEEYWAKMSGPIFFYTGNEGPITAFWNASGFIRELANKYYALVVFGEHRYYGTSLPFGNNSFTKTNIGFLSMEQALADYAVLLKYIKKEYNAENCSVITFGGSYGGMLSGYMRYKYPHIIDAAVASSAPFYTIAGNRPRNEFFQAVTNTCYKADANCPSHVRMGFSELQNLFLSGSAGLTKITEVFNLCSNQARPGFEKHLYGWIRNAFTMMAMGDYPYPADFLGPLPAYPITVACKYMADTTDKLAGLAEATLLLYGSKVQCHDTYQEFIECADPTGCGTGNAALAWDYQACTEMILPGGSNNITDMFPPVSFTLEMRQEYCDNTWGLGKQRLNWIGTEYWGTARDIQQASKIIFPNGDLDPWMPGGVLQNLSTTLKAILIKNGAHHLDLRGSNPKDPPSVREARQKISWYLSQWIFM